MESLNQAKNSVSEPITSISEQIQPSASIYTHAHTHAHEREHTRTHNAHVYEQMHSISKANWIGTAVPNSGYVENVYFNNNLSVDSVKNTLVNILTNNLQADEFGQYTYYFIVAEEWDRLITASYLQSEDYVVIVAIIDSKPHYVYSSKTMSDDDTTIEQGWHNFEFEINEDVLPDFEDGSGEIGQLNEHLSNIFSITPFEQSSNNELSIGNLFVQLGNAIIIFGGAVVNVFISMEPIFWNEGPTLIFILLIASVSFALVFWGIELLISLIGVFKTKRKKKK